MFPSWNPIGSKKDLKWSSNGIYTALEMNLSWKHEFKMIKKKMEKNREKIEENKGKLVRRIWKNLKIISRIEKT